MKGAFIKMTKKITKSFTILCSSADEEACGYNCKWLATNTYPERYRDGSYTGEIKIDYICKLFKSYISTIGNYRKPIRVDACIEFFGKEETPED